MSATVTLLETRRFVDARGWFAETWSEARLSAAGIHARFVQDNQSWSESAGTIRGIHYQAPPRAQAKLVRCVRGSVMDYAVDLRGGSPTFGKSACAMLSAANGRQLFVPVGFGHAFVTLEADTEVAYKVSDIYSPDHEGGVVWDDPKLAIAWPSLGYAPVLSDRDRVLPRLSEFQSPFSYDGVPMTRLGHLADVD